MRKFLEGAVVSMFVLSMIASVLATALWLTDIIMEESFSDFVLPFIYPFITISMTIVGLAVLADSNKNGG